MKEFIPRHKDDRLDTIKPFSLEELSRHDRALVPETVMKLLGFKTKVQLDEFKERIRNTGGMLRIFVHPFFLEEDRNASEDSKTRFAELYGNYDKAATGAKRHIESEGKVPLIIFEEHGKEREVLDDQIVIPTKLSSGEIYIPFLSPLSVFDIYKDRLAWVRGMDRASIGMYEKRLAEEKAKENPDKDVIADYADLIHSKSERIQSGNFLEMKYFARSLFYKLIVSELGIKKVVMGGMYISDMDYDLRGCLGQVIKALRKESVRVTLSRYNLELNKKNVHGKDLY
jgi:hypothetical protein